MMEAYRGPHGVSGSDSDTPVEVDQWQLEKLALVGGKHELFFYTPGRRSEELGGLASRMRSRSLDGLWGRWLRRFPKPGATRGLLPEGPIRLRVRRRCMRESPA